MNLFFYSLLLFLVTSYCCNVWKDVFNISGQQCYNSRQHCECERGWTANIDSSCSCNSSRRERNAISTLTNTRPLGGQTGYWPVDVRLVDNKQYFASVAVRGRPLVVGRLSAAHPAQSGRGCRRHLPHAGAERRVRGDGRRPALRRRPVTVAVGWRPACRARPRQVILQVARAESSTEEVDPRRDVVAKAWVRNLGGLHNPAVEK